MFILSISILVVLYYLSNALFKTILSVFSKLCLCIAVLLPCLTLFLTNVISIILLLCLCSSLPI